jgi:hypothetical protein
VSETFSGYPGDKLHISQFPVYPRRSIDIQRRNCLFLLWEFTLEIELKQN